MFRAVLACALLVTSCKSESGADPSETDVTSSPQKGSSGGFSASLSAELGSNAKPAAGSAGSSAKAGSASAGSATPVAAGSATPVAAGSATPVAAGSAAPVASAPVDAAVAAPADASVAKAGSAAPVAAGSAATPVAAGSAAKPVAAGSASTPVVATPKTKPVMTPELAAIKLSLQPNWVRDVEEAGSISLVVNVQSRNETTTFKFNYGYDDPKAPADRDAYKKFLADSGALKVLTDRQSSAAWYLEGTDATGHAGFRVLVQYGGKRLVCYGSLYKDSGLGDIRDEVLIQAKKICESIQL